MYYTAKRIPCQPLGSFVAYLQQVFGLRFASTCMYYTQKRITRQPLGFFVVF